MSASKTKHVIVFKTGKLYELDMATEALKENNIPFYRQSESSSGLRTAMPAQPTMGPGTWYSILVPEIAVEDAKAILAELPFEIGTNPDIWHFRPDEKVKKWWKMYGYFILAISIVMLITYVIAHLRN
jgi:hypothetical protein